MKTEQFRTSNRFPVKFCFLLLNRAIRVLETDRVIDLLSWKRMSQRALRWISISHNLNSIEIISLFSPNSIDRSNSDQNYYFASNETLLESNIRTDTRWVHHISCTIREELKIVAVWTSSLCPHRPEIHCRFFCFSLFVYRLFWHTFHQPYTQTRGMHHFIASLPHSLSLRSVLIQSFCLIVALFCICFSFYPNNDQPNSDCLQLHVHLHPSIYPSHTQRIRNAHVSTWISMEKKLSEKQWTEWLLLLLFYPYQLQIVMVSDQNKWKMNSKFPYVNRIYRIVSQCSMLSMDIHLNDSALSCCLQLMCFIFIDVSRVCESNSDLKTKLSHAHLLRPATELPYPALPPTLHTYSERSERRTHA